MFSTASGWSLGRRIWSVTHDRARGPEHLATDGTLPLIFDRIHERLRLEQSNARHRNDGIDYFFYIPVDLAESLCGYRYDMEPREAGVDLFEVLAANGVG